MGWFWADNARKTASSCPVPKPVQSTYASGCPVVKPKSETTSEQDECPVDHSSILNPMNNMPVDISSERAPGQKVILPTERTISTIPRGEKADMGFWEYPSPQQMLNAMLRKGKGSGIDEDAVVLMVEVHNFLNEAAWQQISAWEEPYTQLSMVSPRLLKFTGRPHDLSPRARLFLMLGKVFPETFNTQPPFDRHDWTVLRSVGNDKWQNVRYVIDYYGAPDDEETGMPSFMLDTRPALDSVGSAYDRVSHWAGPLWKKAMGEPYV